MVQQCVIAIIYNGFLTLIAMRYHHLLSWVINTLISSCNKPLINGLLQSLDKNSMGLSNPISLIWFHPSESTVFVGDDSPYTDDHSAHGWMFFSGIDEMMKTLVELPSFCHLFITWNPLIIPLYIYIYIHPIRSHFDICLIPFTPMKTSGWRVHRWMVETLYWLVVDLPLWKIWVSWDDDIPNIWKSKKCSKPPTSYK